ncbi:MAG: MFS transporter [Bacteroidetes bacterium]|nr:MFS transporter [Bacteroidota bacterium]MCB0842570.1 MFS transporter [Bacteroidota bacterium]
MKNDLKLFYGSCFALITTAFSFSIRAGILPELGAELDLNAAQLGFINSMWFFGFPISMVIGGLIYHSVGGKAIMQFAFVAHALGILLTIFAGSYEILLVSTLLIGLGNGCTEAACNPMIAETWEGEKMSKMLNRFHMWFPGGIVLGSLISQAMGPNGMGLPWQAQIWVILVPTVIYAYLFWTTSWPKAQTEAAASVTGNLKAMLTPLFLFMLGCMALTAISEFGPQQWVELTLAESGAQPMIILALVTGLMAVARYFGGEAVHRFNTTGVLLGSAILATIGIFLFSIATGPMAYVAAIVYALGIAYFWPNMIGFIAEYIPDSGALGMSIVGAMGMFSSAIFQPIIGGWIDGNRAEGTANGLEGSALELYTGQETLGTMIMFPLILIGLFTLLFFWMRNRQKQESEPVSA